MKMIKAEKEVQIDILNEELDLQEELYKAEKERLEEQIDSYKDLIDEKKKSLKLDKDEDDYLAEVSEKNKKISDIQNKLDELQFDNSAQAIAQKLELQADLAEKQKDLAETQSDREYDLTVDALDDEYDAYESAQDAQIALMDEAFEATETDYENRIDLLKKYLEEENTIRADAMDLIESKTADFYDRLFAWNIKYGETTNAVLQSIIDKSQEIVTPTTSKSSSSKKTTTTTTTSGNSGSSGKSGSQFKLGAGSGGSLTLKPSSPVNRMTHHDGLDSGFVGSGLNGNESFIKALDGEVLTNPKQQDAFMEKILPNMLKNAYVSGTNNTLSGNTMSYDKLIEINVSGSIDSDSVTKVQATVNQAFEQLTNAFSQRGTVRKANSFAT